MEVKEIKVAKWGKPIKKKKKIYQIFHNKETKPELIHPTCLEQIF
jgi:hypothetical protein